MGYICEYEEPECIPKENANLDIYDYKIVMPDSPETVNFEEARSECQKYGKGTGCSIHQFNSYIVIWTKFSKTILGVIIV